MRGGNFRHLDHELVRALWIRGFAVGIASSPKALAANPPVDDEDDAASWRGKPGGMSKGRDSV
jgi:hypothetical protein